MAAHRPVKSRGVALSSVAENAPGSVKPAWIIDR